MIFINMANLESNAVYDSWIIKNNSVNEEIFFLNSGTNGKQITFQNMLLANNTASNRPGLVFDNYRGKINIINSTIFANTATQSTAKESAQIFANYPSGGDAPVINIFNTIVGANNGFAVSWYQWTDATYDFTINVDNSYIEGGTSSID